MSRLSQLRWPLGLGLTSYLTMTWAGALHWVIFQGFTTHHAPDLYSLSAFQHGLWFTLGLMGMLLVHEGAHMAACWAHGLKFEGPFILPAPFQLIGTLGAFLRLRSPYQTRTQMVDIASAGPIAGFLWSLGAIVIGLRWSAVTPEHHDMTNLVRFGTPVIFRLLEPGHDFVLHPLAAGGWIGCLVTMINLLPFEHFDGGTLLHGLMPKTARIAGVLMFCAAFYFAGASIFTGSLTWAIALAVAILVLLTAGFQPDPPILDRLPWRAHVLAVLCAICLILSWTAL